MQEQEIIIDGVDVSKCENYSPLEHSLYGDGWQEEPNYCAIDHNHICEGKNCYYKQLQKLKQENQELRDNYVKLDLQRVDDINSLVKANELLFQMAILAQQEYEDIDCYKTLKIDWFKHLQKIKTLREYKSNVMDRIKNYKKVAHDIDKEIEKRLKNGEVEE